MPRTRSRRVVLLEAFCLFIPGRGQRASTPPDRRASAFLARFRAMVSTLHKTTDTLGDNMGLVAAVIAVVVAQILKPFSEWTVSGRFKPGLAVGSGGFPSSHSSLVTALATGAAYQVGLADPAFATALVLALVVRPPNGPSPPNPVRAVLNTPHRLPASSRAQRP